MKICIISVIAQALILSSACFAQVDWSASNTGLPSDIFVNGLTQASSGDIYALTNTGGGTGGLYTSSDDGSSWSLVTTTGLPSGSWGTGLLSFDSGKLLLSTGGSGSRLYSATLSSSTGFSTAIFSDLAVFPNPTRRELFLRSSEEINLVQVFAGNGRKVYEAENLSHNATIHLFDEGLYILKVYADNGQVVRKICVH